MSDELISVNASPSSTNMLISVSLKEKNGETFRCTCDGIFFRWPEPEAPCLFACITCGERWIGREESEEP